jgi:hypothetical protein
MPTFDLENQSFLFGAPVAQKAATPKHTVQKTQD